MTAFCDWIAVIAFFIALLLCLIQPAVPATYPARWSWPTFVAIGLLAWAIPVALTASHISHS
jgi:hypothetical protein